MAGDWIPMRVDLWECPQVVRIMSAMCPHDVHEPVTKCQIIGALYRTWAIVDQYCDDGILDGYTADALNQAVGIDTWAESLQHVGWLRIEAQHLEIPSFEEWFSSSAKRRLKDAKRKRKARSSASASCPQRVRKTSASKRTREEERREENNKKPPISPKGDSSFDRFWEAYPKKAYRDRAERAFEVAEGVAEAETIIEAAVAFANSPLGKSSKCPTAATWLRCARWNDKPSEWNVDEQRTEDDYLAEAHREAMRTRERYCRNERASGGLDEVDENWRSRLAGGSG